MNLKVLVYQFSDVLLDDVDVAGSDDVFHLVDVDKSGEKTLISELALCMRLALPKKVKDPGKRIATCQLRSGFNLEDAVRSMENPLWGDATTYVCGQRDGNVTYDAQRVRVCGDCVRAALASTKLGG